MASEGPTIPFTTTVTERRRPPWFGVAIVIVAIMWAATLTVVLILQNTADTLVPAALSLAVTASVSLVAWACMNASRRDNDAGRRILQVQLNALTESAARNFAVVQSIKRRLADDDWQDFAEAVKYLPSGESGRVIAINGRGSRGY